MRLKKVLLSCAVAMVGLSTVSAEEIVIDASLKDYMRKDSIQVVYDLKNDLMWQDDERAKTVQEDKQGAINYCKNLNFAGYTNWRLPNNYELKSIIDSKKIKSKFKNIIASQYCSSDFSPSSHSVLVGGGGYGGVYNVNDRYYVRCIKDIK